MTCIISASLLRKLIATLMKHDMIAYGLHSIKSNNGILIVLHIIYFSITFSQLIYQCYNFLIQCFLK